jgi:methyl-accepting chemotaxis protein
MSTNILRKSPIERFRALESRLSSLGKKLDGFKSKSVNQLDRDIYKLNESLIQMQESLPFASTVKNPKYVVSILTKDALTALKEHKTMRDEAVKILEGMTYYSAKNIYGRIVGKRATIKENKALWYNINEDTRVLKATEILRHGSDENFRKIYFEYANGMGLKALDKFDFNHIKKSTPKALNLIEAYCDRFWEGKWPWEHKAPKKVYDLIKETKEMSIKKYRSQFDFGLQSLLEGEMEKSQIVTELGTFIDKVDSMIETLGRTSGTLMTTTRDAIRTEFGDDAMSDMESALSDKIRSTVDALSDLKTSIAEKVDSLSGNTAEPSAKAEFDDMGAGPDADMVGDMGDDGDMAEIEFDDEDVAPAEDDFDFDLDNMSGEREKK